jgi:hypothetical protein
MVFEKFIRYAGLAVGLNPSATECEARLRGLERMMYSKTMTPAARPINWTLTQFCAACLQR